MHVGLLFDDDNHPDIDHLDVGSQPQLGTVVDLLGETFMVHRVTLVARQDPDAASGIHRTWYVVQLARYVPPGREMAT